ncbi:MAG TPA: class I SAM-dependent methyltransferase [Actinomycetes bacterium]|nr:class I SAM-dependent methyltransferase [Actinomycetes bacterium]
MAKTPSLSFERIAESYDATRGGEKRGAAFAAGIRPWLPGRGPILEVGVGTGTVALALRRDGLDVLGVDLSPAMLARAAQRLGPRVGVADAQRLPIATGSMSGVYATWVLHVVADPGAVLSEVARVLRPDGAFVAVLSTPMQLVTDVDRLLRRMQARLRGERADTPERISSLAAAAGLELAGRADIANEMHETVPTEVVERIYDRTYSILWDLDDATWQAEVEPTVAALRALPAPGRARVHQDHYPLLVFRLPAAGL